MSKANGRNAGTCTVGPCKNHAFARGHCQKHYHQWWYARKVRGILPVRHPRPWEYRNPYVTRYRGTRPGRAKVCPDCGIAIYSNAARCRSCAQKARSYDIGDTARAVMTMVESGEAASVAHVAAIVGVSRQRVHQILHRAGSDFGKPIGDIWVEWLCAECGAATGMWRRQRFAPRTGLCRKCALRRTHCKNGHELTDGNRGAGGRCLICCDSYHRTYRANPVNKARAAQWQHDNAAKCAGYYRKYYERHREAILVRLRERYHDRQRSAEEEGA